VILNISQPYRPLRPFTGIALLYFFTSTIEHNLLPDCIIFTWLSTVGPMSCTCNVLTWRSLREGCRKGTRTEYVGFCSLRCGKTWGKSFWGSMEFSRTWRRKRTSGSMGSSGWSVDPAGCLLHLGTGASRNRRIYPLVCDGGKTLTYLHILLSSI
jgi:hypothetical protein